MSVAGPTLSVILLSYNQERHVASALASILRSDSSLFEVLCVDDGSTDDTWSILSHAAGADPRVRAFRLPHSGRPAVSRNAGLDAAKGEFVAFLDGDDLYANGKVDVLLSLLKSQIDGSDVAFHDYLDFDDAWAPERGVARLAGSASEAAIYDLAMPVSGRTQGESDAIRDAGVRRCVRIDGDDLVAFLVADAFVVMTGSIVIRRSLIADRGLRFPEDRVCGEDNIFWLQCMLASSVVYIPKVLLHYRKHAASLSTARTPAKQQELARSMEDQLALVSHLLTPSQYRAAKEKIRFESGEIGWHFERLKQPGAAAAAYLETAVEYRAPQFALRAAKAMLRPLSVRLFGDRFLAAPPSPLHHDQPRTLA